MVRSNCLNDLVQALSTHVEHSQFQITSSPNPRPVSLQPNLWRHLSARRIRHWADECRSSLFISRLWRVLYGIATRRHFARMISRSLAGPNHGSL